MLLKLGRLGLNGAFLRIIQASYTNLKSVVRVASTTSGPFDVARGVRQGGVVSTFLYLVYVNDLLNDLEASKNGAKVMTVNTGNPTFADDIALIALFPLHLQKMVDIVYRYCYYWNIYMNAQKSHVMVFSQKGIVPRLASCTETRF